MAKRIFGSATGAETQQTVEVTGIEISGVAEVDSGNAADEVKEAVVENFEIKEGKPARRSARGKAAEAVEQPAQQRRQLFRPVPNLTAGLEGVSSALFSSALKGDDEEMERLFREGIQGLPQEHLFLQGVMGMDAIPIGQNISLIGEASSCKTWLGWELAKPFIYGGGMTYLIRAEKKWDPESARAITTLARNPDYDPFLKPGSDPDYEDMAGANPFFTLVPEVFSLKTEKQNGYISVLCAESIEDIQRSVMADSAGIAALYGKELGKGKDKQAIPRFPVYFLFDSLQYVTTESVMDATEKDKEEGFVTSPC